MADRFDPTQLEDAPTLALPGEEVEEPMDLESPEDRLEKLAGRAVEQAKLWREEDLAFAQEKATDYYMGRPFGDEVEGRSRVVSTDVRDTVQGILPSLMRIFFGPDKNVQYEPREPEDVPIAEQLTDMADIVIRQDNDGFLQIYGAMKDAMVRKLGVLKVWWEEKERTEGYEITGIGEEGLQALMTDEDNEVEIVSEYGEPAPGTPTGFVTMYDVFVTRRSDDGRVKFAAVPPEEFVFSPDARDRDSADMMGHVRLVPASELIAMGVDADLVEKHKGKLEDSTNEDMEVSRRFDQRGDNEWHEEKDVSREDCLYGEVYIYADMTPDESGRAALIKCQLIGPSYELVDWEYCHHRPFAIFVCDPEPHTLIGLSTADYVMDIQRIKSALIRGMLDSLTLSLNPRTVVSEAEVNMADVLNHEIGGIIRVDRDVNAVKEFVHRFDTSGAAAFPMLQYIDEQRENRTGQSKAAMGLDADALQSSTKAAVAATLSASQQRIEMLARTFAETGFKQLYQLILETLVMHQSHTRMVRLRNEWVPMDPSIWHTNLDVRVNIALGAGGTEEKIQLLSLISEKQKELMNEGSPLVDLVRYRKGLARQVELAGFSNPDEFFKPWSEQDEQQYQQMKAQQPPQDPTILAIEAQKQIEAAKLELQRQEMLLKDANDKAKIQLDYAMKQAAAEAQYQTKINDMEMQQDAMAAKAVIDAAAKEAIAREQAKAQAAQQQATPTQEG